MTTMNGKLTGILRAARDLRDRLTAEGRHRDAEVLQTLIRSRESSHGLNQTLHTDNARLREQLPS